MVSKARNGSWKCAWAPKHPWKVLMQFEIYVGAPSTQLGASSFPRSGHSSTRSSARPKRWWSMSVQNDKNERSSKSHVPKHLKRKQCHSAVLYIKKVETWNFWQFEVYRLSVPFLRSGGRDLGASAKYPRDFGRAVASHHLSLMESWIERGI